MGGMRHSGIRIHAVVKTIKIEIKRETRRETNRDIRRDIRRETNRETRRKNRSGSCRDPSGSGGSCCVRGSRRKMKPQPKPKP